MFERCLILVQCLFLGFCGIEVLMFNVVVLVVDELIGKLDDLKPVFDLGEFFVEFLGNDVVY